MKTTKSLSISVTLFACAAQIYASWKNSIRKSSTASCRHSKATTLCHLTPIFLSSQISLQSLWNGSFGITRVRAFIAFLISLKHRTPWLNLLAVIFFERGRLLPEPLNTFLGAFASPVFLAVCLVRAIALCKRIPQHKLDTWEKLLIFFIQWNQTLKNTGVTLKKWTHPSS